jgi:hypothetical protein
MAPVPSQDRSRVGRVLRSNRETGGLAPSGPSGNFAAQAPVVTYGRIDERESFDAQAQASAGRCLMLATLSVSSPAMAGGWWSFIDLEGRY